MTNLEYLKNLHRLIPPDYYEVGIKKNLCQNYWHKKRIKAIKKFLESLKNNLPILDLGCHSGWLTNQIAQFINSNDVYGIDISKQAIDYAKKRYKELKFFEADISKGIPFSDKKFKIVTAFDVLEHIPDTCHFLKEIFRILQEGGYLMIGLPTETLLFKIVWWLWLKLKGRVWQETHLHHYKIKEIEKLIEKNGFQKIDEIKIHLGMYWLAKFKKIIK